MQNSISEHPRCPVTKKLGRWPVRTLSSAEITWNFNHLVSMMWCVSALAEETFTSWIILHRQLKSISVISWSEAQNQKNVSLAPRFWSVLHSLAVLEVLTASCHAGLMLLCMRGWRSCYLCSLWQMGHSEGSTKLDLCSGVFMISAF